MPVQILHLLFIIVCLIIELSELLYIVDISSLSDVCIANNFSCSVACFLFLFLYSALEEQKFLSFMNIIN